MKNLAWISALVCTLLLGGCATTVRSKVTTFNQWPAETAERSYAFEAPAPAEDTLEYRNYLNLVRGELGALGFSESATPKLKVSFHFAVADQPVHVVEHVDPMFYGSARFGRFYHPYFGMYGYYPYGPYAADFVDDYLRRKLTVAIKTADTGKRLFEVTVRNVNGEESTPAIMPALVHSAFAGFPGPNGQVRVIDVKLP